MAHDRSRTRPTAASNNSSATSPQLQADAIYRQINANLVRQRLKDTLAIAVHALERISVGFDGNVARMADDLNGGGQR